MAGSPCHVEFIAGFVAAGFDVLDLLFGERRQGDGLDAVSELAVDAAAGRTHERVEVRDNPLRQLQNISRGTGGRRATRGELLEQCAEGGFVARCKTPASTRKINKTSNAPKGDGRGVAGGAGGCHRKMTTSNGQTQKFLRRRRMLTPGALRDSFS